MFDVLLQCLDKSGASLDDSIRDLYGARAIATVELPDGSYQVAEDVQVILAGLVAHRDMLRQLLERTIEWADEVERVGG